MRLFEYTPHPHRPRNVNTVQAAERQGINARIAILLTKWVGTMTCAYFFAILAIIGWPGLHATPVQWVQWLSQTFIQLVMLSVIMVGQGVLGRKQELQSDEQFATTMKIYHDIDQVMKHLDAQDQKILQILEKINERKAAEENSTPS